MLAQGSLHFVVIHAENEGLRVRFLHTGKCWWVSTASLIPWKLGTEEVAFPEILVSDEEG